RTTWSTPGFCSPMAFSMPAGVSYTRCGGLPRRGSRVVPLSTMAPASRFEKPSIRVYSSPKPTQPESSTIGEAKSRPENLSRKEAGSASEAAGRSEEHTSELQSPDHLVCRLLLEKKKK